MELLMSITTIFTLVSSFLLVGLLYIYAKNLRKIKSKFTAGLFIFAALFLLQNLVSLYFYFTMNDYYVAEVTAHVFIFTLLQAIAFLVLLIITWE